MKTLLGLLCLISVASCGIEMSVDAMAGEVGIKKKAEDAIPVIEIRGEGKPMTSAQIRHLEEVSNGGPLDIKIEKVWKPAKCPHAAKRKDFITINYKCSTEDGKLVDQSYGRESIRMQLGVGMAMPGLDKGIAGMCNEELRKIKIPFRLSRKQKSKVWKGIPNDEHWVTMQVELMEVEPYTHEKQFAFMDADNDTKITTDDLIKWSESMKKNFGKSWKNEDIDNVIAAKYYVKYFDVNGDGEITVDEFVQITDRDIETMEAKRSKAKGRKRDPGFAWILDFDNDGVVSYEENDEAPTRLEAGPVLLPSQKKDEL